MDNPYILSVYCCGATALKLRNYLREKSGRNVMYMRPGLRYFDQYIKSSPLVRWGNGESIDSNKDTNFNNRDHIHFTSHKVRMSNYLNDHKLPCVTFHKGTPEKFPVVVRQQIAGQGGKGIVIAEDYKSWLPYSYYWYSYFFPFEYELGVHMLGGKVVKIYRKEIYEGMKEDKFPIRNNDNKYHYRLKDNKYYQGAVELAERIFKVFPIQMTRIDMGYCNGKFYVIEMNSAPSLNSINIPIYGDFILNNINI